MDHGRFPAERHRGPRRLQPKIFHKKFILRDYRKAARPTTALLTPANFTDTDTHTQEPEQRVRLPRRRRLPSVPRRGGAAAARLLRTRPPRRGAQDLRPRRRAGQGLFAPDHTPELEFMKQMLKVKEQREIWFAIFTFAGSSGIDDTMLALARGGVKIRGLLDPAQAKQKWAVPQWLKHDNIELRVPKKEGDPCQPAQGAPQGDGHRRPHRRRRQLQLHPAGQRLQTTRTCS